MARVLYFDCFAGAAGDMILGALLDVGVPLEQLQQALGSLGVDHELRVRRVVRAGISANHVQVVERAGGGDRVDQDGKDHHHHHDHSHGHGGHTGHGGHDHGHRSLAEIADLIHRSALSPAGRERAVRLFQRIGEAEAAIHAVPLDQIHLHEVGALDSIIDIVGTVFALEWLGVDSVMASPLNVGSGTVKMAHGEFPVPAPATLRLLSGVPVYSSGIPAELVTPTGALIVSDYASAYGPLPAMTVERVGYGAGTRELDPVPNVLRVVLGERHEGRAPSPASDAVVEIRCEIDDMNPQLFGPLTGRLFETGALDVYLTPVQMKKGRPGTLVTVLGHPEDRPKLAAILLEETTTLGVRWQTAEREVLARRYESVEVEGGVVRMKLSERDGRLLDAMPEFDDCVRISEASGRPVKVVHADALRAWALRAGRDKM